VCADLLQRFAQVSDGRRDQGRVHPVAVVLALCAAAVVAGMASFTAIAGWATDVPAELLAKLYGRPSDAPSKATIWRVVTGADAAAVDAAIGAWLLTHSAARDSAARDTSVPETEQDAPEPLAIMVDGKAVRGATDAEGNQTHLLAAATHDDALVLGQVEVGAKSNEIPQFAPLLDTLTAAGIDLAHTVITADALHTQRAHADYLHERGAGFVFTAKQNQCATRRSVTSPPQAGQTRREVCWVRWLTWIRKVKGTRACQETDDRAQVPGTGCRAMPGRSGSSRVAPSLG
jgi:predicted transposase YbfD/YdcC